MGNGEIFRADRESELTIGQRSRLALLMQAILDTINTYARRPTAYGHSSDAATIERPHNVFSIDGGRGSGKTFVLLTLEYLLRRLSEQRRDSLQQEWPMLDWGGWTKLVEAVGSRAPVLPLRIIFPSDLTDQEFVMEVMFASIERDIKAHMKSNPTELAVKKKGDELLKMLSNDIARGQYHARRFGVDAVVRDSMNYNDLVRKYGELNEIAAFRTEQWRMFIDDYLDWRGVHALALLLDDSDLRPEVTNDLLHTARTMFSHRRIITVIAGNTHSIRSSLLNIRLRELAKVMPALNQQDHPSGTEWRRAERQSVEQILEKVLPESKRYYLPPTKIADFQVLLRGFGDNEEEPKDVFKELVRSTIRSLRGEFMRTKMLLGFLHETGGGDLPSEKQLLALEDYLSWWVFQTKYIPRLRPRSARQAKAFADYYGSYFIANKRSESSGTGHLKPPHKRLSVAMFENASNYALIQQFDDNESHVTGWLGRQKISSDWSAGRAFKINTRRIPIGSYSYDYLCFRMDIGLSLPLRENPEALVPRTLLPVVRGRKRIRHFYQPAGTPERPKLLGISRWIDHAAIPGNCLFFYHLNALPDIAFVAGEDLDRSDEKMATQGGIWECKLQETWEEQLERTDDAGTRKLVNHVNGWLPDTVKPTEKLPVGTSSLNKALPKDSTFDAVNVGLGEKDPDDESGPRYTTKSNALRSALFNDLRRGWHALLIWEASRKPDLSEEGTTPATGWLLSGIASTERMKLYTLEELRETLQRDAWLSDMLIVFARLVSNEVDPGNSIETKQRQIIRKLIDASSAKDAPFLKWKKGQPSAFASNYEGENGWEVSWRRLSRQMCTYWLISEGSPDKKIVESLFKGYNHRRVHIFRVNADQENADDENSDPTELIARARSVRAFIWLMYGLSPSLPAMIHLDMESNFPANTYGNVIKRKERLAEWNKLILQLTAMTRYLKYKCLLMYLVSTLTHVKANASTGNDPWPGGLRLHAASIRAWMIANLNFSSDSLSIDDAEFLRQLASQCDQWLKDAVLHTQEIRELAKRQIDPSLLDLNIMPDASPSTLFGDGWLQRILGRIDNLSNTKKSERGTFGLFGETDRWLWAAHKMIGEAWTDPPSQSRPAQPARPAKSAGAAPP